MKVTIWTSDGSGIEVKSFELDTIFMLKDALNDPEQLFLQFQITTVSGGDTTIFINRDHIVRIDMDEED